MWIGFCVLNTAHFTLPSHALLLHTTHYTLHTTHYLQVYLLQCTTYCPYTYFLYCTVNYLRTYLTLSLIQYHIRPNCTHQCPLCTTYSYKHNSALNNAPKCRNFRQTSRLYCGSRLEYELL